MTLNVNVTDPEVIAAMKAWQNGAAYNLSVTQDAPMQFTVNAAEEAPVVEEEAPEPAYEPSAAATSPGVSLLMNKK